MAPTPAEQKFGKVGKGPGPFAAGMLWDSWAERFEFFIKLRGVTDESMKKLLLFTELGPIYEELRQMAQPDDVRNMNFDEILALMAERFGETKTVAAKRHELFSARQKSNQSIRDFSIQLRSLIAKAEWSQDSVDMCLSALFINGIASDAIRAELIKKGDKNLKFKDAVETAVLLEQSELDAHAIGSGPVAEVAKVCHQPKREGWSKPKAKDQTGVCHRCGVAGHWARNCSHANDTCNKCGKKGHWAKECRANSTGQSWRAARGRGQSSGGARTERKVNQIRAWKASIGSAEVSSVVKKANVKAVTIPTRLIEMEVHKGTAKFELDTGADVSLINERDWQRIGKPKLEQSPGLLAYGEVPIKDVLGTAEVQVAYNGRRTSAKMYVIGGQKKNLCGRDVIKGLNIDLNKEFGIESIHKVMATQEVEAVLKKYPDVFKDGLGRCTKQVSLRFKDGVQPKYFKPRPVPFALRQTVEKALERWQSEGVLTPVTNSEWATPLVIVPKPSGEVRLCCDYKVTVNPWLDIHQYPLPRAEDLFTTLNGGQRFSKLDLKEAYLQLLLDEQSKKCLTISTHKGLFQFERMPYGVASAPAIFQQTMEEILQGIEGVAVYLDDILITATNDTDHLKRLDKVLQRLQQHGLRVKKEKCAFMQEKIEYLGHIVDKDGIHTSPEKVEAIVKMPAPTNLKELQSFLGMVNYYGKYVPAMATVAEPLNELRRTETKWHWGKEQQDAFRRIKEMLRSNELLVHYNPDRPVYLAADASDYGVGAVLFHKDGKMGKVGVIAYASRTLSSAERNYAQIEKEGRAIIFGVEKFNQYLYGRHFTLQTDHEPLKRIFGPKGEIPVVAARRLHRWSLILMSYDFEIEYCPTNQFGNADVLSRLPCPEEASIHQIGMEVSEIQEQSMESLPVTAKAISEEIGKDKVLSAVKGFLEQAWPQKIEDDALKPYKVVRNDLELRKGCIMFGVRTVIPQRFRKKVLDLIHATHPGIVRMKALARQKVWWPGIDKDIENIRKSCKTCQTNAPEERKVPLHPWEVPEREWQRLHIDFCGPFWGSMWLIIVDAKTKWPEIVKMRSTSAEATIEAVRQVFGTHGLPEQIVSDNGPQFTSADWEEYCRTRGIVRTLTPPYHPQSNGEAERMVQSFKQGMKLMKDEGARAEVALHQFLLRYRVTPHVATGKSPAELLVGRKLRTLLDLVTPIPEPKRSGKEEEQSKYAERTKRNFDRNKREKSLEIGQRIYARNYREGPNWLQGQILKEVGTALFRVRTSRGVWTRHLDQLKPDVSYEGPEQLEDESEDDSVAADSLIGDAPPRNDPDLQEPLGEEPEKVQVRQEATPPLRRSNRNRKPTRVFDPSGEKAKN